MATILVIDDDRSTLLLCEAVLKKEGYQVTSATNGREALERFRSERPDLVVLDISMPGMDGLEVLARIMSIDRRVPVVLNSGYRAYKENFLSWSADAYVLKTPDASDLKRTINDLLDRRLTAGSNAAYQKARA